MIIKVIIIDDNLETIQIIENAIDQTHDVELIATFNSGEEFFKVFKKLKFDLCIIDYHLPGMTGYDCAKKLVDKNIVLTSSETIPADVVIDMEDVVDVLKIAKPFSQDRFIKSIKKVRDEILSSKGFVVLRTYPNNVRQLNISEIVYVSTDEKDSRVKIIHTIHEKVRTQKYSHDELLLKFPSHQFCQINRSELINLNYFHSFNDSDSIFLTVNANEKPIELSITDKHYPNFASLLGIEKE